MGRRALAALAALFALGTLTAYAVAGATVTHEYVRPGTTVVIPAETFTDSYTLPDPVTETVTTTSPPVTVTETVTTTTSAPPPPNPDPSGEAMPVGDLSGWTQIFSDNFAGVTQPLGSYCGDPAGFPHGSTKWNAYPYTWQSTWTAGGSRGTPTWGNYCPERTTSIAAGVMDIWLHTETDANAGLLHEITANVPRATPSSSYLAQKYGRYAVRYRLPAAFPMFHVSWLLWPTSNTWPRDGEIDFPEGDTSSSVTSAFMHWQGGTSGGSQDAYTAQTPLYGAWHTAVIEWLPTRCTFILDGTVIGNSTVASRIPSTPMLYVLQHGGRFGITPDNTSEGHVQVDWVTVYARA